VGLIRANGEEGSVSALEGECLVCRLQLVVEREGKGRDQDKEVFMV
jgi:hypothetical protein